MPTNHKTEKPILFSGAMVRAILEGRKTQTRRVVKFLPEYPRAQFVRIKHDARISRYDPVLSITHADAYAACPYGAEGDRLWVRETWAIRDCGKRVSLSPEAWAQGWPLTRLQYVATDKAPTKEGYWWNTRSPIHMPRWASRLTLEITNVRVERLQEISETDIQAEGITLPPTELYPEINTDYKLRQQWQWGWDKLNAKRGYSWESNPWVWVIEFKKVEQPST